MTEGRTPEANIPKVVITEKPPDDAGRASEHINQAIEETKYVDALFDQEPDQFDASAETNPASVARMTAAAEYAIKNTLARLQKGEDASLDVLTYDFGAETKKLGNATDITSMGLRLLRSKLEEARDTYDALGKRDVGLKISQLLVRLERDIKNQDGLEDLTKMGY